MVCDTISEQFNSLCKVYRNPAANPWSAHEEEKPLGLYRLYHVLGIWKIIWIVPNLFVRGEDIKLLDKLTLAVLSTERISRYAGQLTLESDLWCTGLYMEGDQKSEKECFTFWRCWCFLSCWTWTLTTDLKTLSWKYWNSLCRTSEYSGDTDMRLVPDSGSWTAPFALFSEDPRSYDGSERNDPEWRRLRRQI